MSDTLLKADRLYRFFHAGDDETLALCGVSLAVRGGEIVAVTGPSGSGKSTLLACLAGLDDPDGGQVVVTGRPMTRRTEAERAALRARVLGVLLQSGNLVEHLTVRGNVALAQRLAGRVRHGQVDRLLQGLGLAARATHRPSQLSRGEAARAGLAVALANEPVVLLADEPTGELDSDNERRVLRLLREIAARGAAVVVASHSRAVALAADRVLALHDGQVRS